MDFNVRDMDLKDTYRLMTSCIVPRPIAWVTSISKKGVYNTAPFSYFTGVSIKPALVLFAVERRHGEKKDTVINIEETKEFVINLVTESNVVQMNLTSKDYTFEEDEIKMAGLTPINSKCVIPPSIKESPIHMECRLHEIIEIGSSPHSLVIGKVINVNIYDDVMVDGKINMERLHAVGRMGDKWYTKTNSLFDLPRLDWRKDEIK